MTQSVRIIFWLITGLLFAFAKNGLAEEEIVVPVSLDNEILVKRFPASGKYLMLWLAPEYGFRNTHHSLARMLIEQNIEVWQGNVVESLFLPQGTASIKQLDGKFVADMIEYAHNKTGKKVVLAGDSYAAVSALLGAHQWQLRKLSEPYLIGAVLFTPYTYAYIPPLGMAPEFLPIISASNIPIMIYQAKKSGIVGQFKALLENLQQRNNPVYAKFVPNIMSLFYQNPPTKEMLENAKLLPVSIKNMISVLEKHTFPDKPIALKTIKNQISGIDIKLKTFKGNDRPFAIKLVDIDGNLVVKNNFSGKVTLINFWATWCPPCVQEIPSLNRLKSKMAGLPFELISINYAEDKDTIVNFMKKVSVDFPVLLDENGDFSKKWNVISYPSTFVIGKNGKIVYGVNAAIEWDDHELIQKIKLLLK